MFASCEWAGMPWEGHSSPPKEYRQQPALPPLPTHNAEGACLNWVCTTLVGHVEGRTIDATTALPVPIMQYNPLLIQLHCLTSLVLLH